MPLSPWDSGGQVFAQITYIHLPKERGIKESKAFSSIVFNGYRELKNVWREFMKLVRLKRYLLSYFVYSMGVQTVMLMAVIFGNKEIDWPEGDTTGLLIAVPNQFNSSGPLVLGFFARLSKKNFEPSGSENHSIYLGFHLHDGLLHPQAN